MEKAKQHTLADENVPKIKEIYSKVIASNSTYIKKGYIKCPECGEEILIIPTLTKMNEAIENHIQLHRQELGNNPLVKYIKPINIRLALAKQTIKQLKAVQSRSGL